MAKSSTKEKSLSLVVVLRPSTPILPPEQPTPLTLNVTRAVLSEEGRDGSYTALVNDLQRTLCISMISSYPPLCLESLRVKHVSTKFLPWMSSSDEHRYPDIP